VALTPLSDGELAAIVTFLEMLEPPRQPVPDSELSLRRIERPGLSEYRDLFRLVGSRWLGFSRLIMDDEELAAIIHDPKVELYCVVDGEGRVTGMAELDFRDQGQCELSFLGLVPELAGMGHGRWLLGESLRLAWREGIGRVHVHTCTLDHPSALPAYVRCGFTAFRRAIERFPDPRLLGVLAADCAPQVPVFGTVTSIDPRPAS
jgi:GNAT superfamily N-acetyltransferase